MWEVLGGPNSTVVVEMHLSGKQLKGPALQDLAIRAGRLD